MTGDHHDRTARRATLLITAADEILGTHTLYLTMQDSVGLCDRLKYVHI
jgi:hypothetical protein